MHVLCLTDYELHHGEEFIGHRMSAFTVDIWTALWEHAPNQCKLLGFNKRPSENLRYHSKWQVRPHCLLIYFFPLHSNPFSFEVHTGTSCSPTAARKCLIPCSC